MFFDIWGLICERAPGGSVHRSNGIIAAFANVNLASFNLCFHEHPIRDRRSLQEILRQANEAASVSQFPWLFVLSEEWAFKEWEETAGQAGFHKVLRIRAMQADELEPPRRPPPRLEYVRVTGKETSWEMAKINCLSHGLTEKDAEAIASPRLWPPETYAYLGCVEGRPVTCAATFAVGEVLYTTFVATLSSELRKGYGEAVMRHSLEQASRGLSVKRKALHATEAGLRLYESMGYRTCAHYSLLRNQAG